MYKKTILDNGLRIITAKMPYMQSVSLGLWINTGGRFESIQLKGISHFLEHLLFKGSKHYSCKEIKESIEGIGGSLNGFTSEEITCYLAKVPAKYAELTLNILSDMVLSPKLAISDIEKERTVILEELKMYKDLPQSYKYELLDELLWPRQSLGLPIIGTWESLTNLRRKDVINYHRNYYTASNIVISLAGSLSHEKIVTQVQKKLSHLPVKSQNTFIKAKEDQMKKQFKLLKKATEQTHLALGFQSLRRDHPQRHSLSLLHIVLGANMSSRLFNELREKRGLAYEIGTSIKRFHDTGAFVIHAGIDNHKVKEALELILKELKRIKSSLLSKREFKNAKEFYLGQLKLSLEDTLEQMLWIGEGITTLDKIYKLNDIIKEVKKVTPQDIKEVAGSIFKEKKLNLALIGPLKGASEITKSLSLN